MTDLLTPAVNLVDGVPRVTSLKIAEHFDKPHDAVLKSVRKIVEECPQDFSAVNFYGAEYSDEQGKPRPMYSLTRDAFTLLAMGFTGKKALNWKLKYIEAFNAMEAELTRRALNKAKRKALPPPPPIAESGAEVLARLMVLHSEFFKISNALTDVLRRPFFRYPTEEDMPGHLREFSKGMNYAIQKLHMSANVSIEVMEHLFGAYVAAEEMLKQCEHA